MSDKLRKSVKPHVMWGGRRWWLRGAYYQNRQGRLLHRAVYRAAFGPIPLGLDIHHKDGNKTNNDPSNLEALSRSEHIRRHRPPGWLKPDHKRVAHAARDAWWANREPWMATCEVCGKQFATTCPHPKVRFCSMPCITKHRRNSEQYKITRSCEWCGKDFRTLKFKKVRFCTSTCAAQKLGDSRKGAVKSAPRFCVVCKAEFKTYSPYTVCCGQKCGRVHGAASKRRGTIEREAARLQSGSGGDS